MKKLLPIIIIAVVVLVVAGFALRSIQKKIGEKVAEKIIEQGTGGKVDIQEGGNKVTIGGNQLPQNLPKDIPIYPGSTPSGSWSASDQTGGGFILGLETRDSSDKVLAYYQKELVVQGWTIESTITVESATVLTIKKDTRTGAVSVSTDKEKNKTIISMTIGSETN